MVHFLVWWLLADCVKLLRFGGIDLIASSESPSQLWQNDLVSLLYILLVVGAAAVTYRVIEVPTRSWSRRLAAPRARQDARIAMQSAPRHAVVD
jgi:peptidoglycan/LPS O-acetylase OafA/YrhL